MTLTIKLITFESHWDAGRLENSENIEYAMAKTNVVLKSHWCR